MIVDNAPLIELGLTCVKLPADRGAVFRVWLRDRAGSRVTLKRWECPSGAPSAAQLLDITSVLAQEAEASVVTSCGVQGVLRV